MPEKTPVTDPAPAAAARTVLAVGAHIGDMDLTAGPLLAEHVLAGGRGVLLALTPGGRGHPRLSPEEYKAQKLAEGEEFARDLGTPPTRIRASVVRSGRFHTSYRDTTWPDITERAARAAYDMAGLGPADLDLVELHDAFAVAEFLHAEALGLVERGTAHKAVAAGEFHRDGRVAVSPSGGLLSRGHPVGATDTRVNDRAGGATLAG